MTLTKPRGRVVLAQSSFLPDMYFAWDARLERVTNEAVRQYYRDRYGLTERDLTSVRSLVGWARAARLRDVYARTVLIERISPLRSADRAYVLEAIFRGTWGQRLQPYLSPADYAELRCLCDPDAAGSPGGAPDFHFLADSHPCQRSDLSGEGLSRLRAGCPEPSPLPADDDRGAIRKRRVA